jgi:hypothetical protein
MSKINGTFAPCLQLCKIQAWLLEVFYQKKYTILFG